MGVPSTHARTTVSALCVGRGRSHYHLRNHPEQCCIAGGGGGGREEGSARALSFAPSTARRSRCYLSSRRSLLIYSERTTDPRLSISSRESRSIWCARARCARGAGARGRVVGACACACADAHARRLFATRSLARTTITFGCRAAPKVGGRGATTLGQSIYLLGAASTHVAAARGYMLYRIHFYRKESANKRRGLFLALALSLVLSLSHPLSPR